MSLFLCVTNFKNRNLPFDACRMLAKTCRNLFFWKRYSYYLLVTCLLLAYSLIEFFLNNYYVNKKKKKDRRLGTKSNLVQKKGLSLRVKSI